MDRHYCPYCMTPVAGDQPCPSCGLTFGTYTPLPHHLPPGTVLMERYLVGRVLGEGGFAVREIPFGGEEYAQCLRLRDEVLRRPLGLNLFAEDLSGEGNCRHIAALRGEKAAGTAQLLPDPERPGAMRVRQVAVSADCRGQGLGRKMLDFAVRLAVREGFSAVTVHARETAAGFYRKMGFIQTGPGFLEVGIPHLPMELALRGEPR